MNSIGLAIALRSAKEWAITDPLSFSRFFEFSQADRQWLVETTEEKMAELCNLPTSPIQIDFTLSKTDRNQVSKLVPTVSIGTVTTILTAVADDLSHDLRVGMINWGISDIKKATWLAESAVQDRLALAMTGAVTFGLRCAFKKIDSEQVDPTARMATLMRILSGTRKASI
jgi:hypothetical protein